MNTTMQGDQSKAAIIKTALELWHEGGEKAVSARAVGKRVGLTHAGVIYHFGNVGGMMDAVKREAVAARDGLIIRQMIVANDPLVAGWSQEDRQQWLMAGG